MIEFVISVTRGETFIVTAENCMWDAKCLAVRLITGEIRRFTNVESVIARAPSDLTEILDEMRRSVE